MHERQVFTPYPGRLDQPPAPPPEDPEVQAAREREAARNERNSRQLEPAIAVYLDCYQALISELALGHEVVGNRTDFDLTGDTVNSAAWLLTGHGIALARATLDLLKLGYAMEAAPLMRALQESNRLLTAVVHDEDLLADWLRDRGQMRFKDVQRTVEEWEQESRQEMVRSGVRPPRSTKTHADRTYALLSDFTHARRRVLVDRVSTPGRQMPIGPHPNVLVRAAIVSEFSIFLGHLVSVGGSTIARFLGPEWMERYQASLNALLDLLRKIDISPETLQKASGAAESGA